MIQNEPSVKIIADSISQDGVRLTTFELEMPRMILAEFNTHRLFSRNSASTRAIPIEKQIEKISKSSFIPTFTKLQKGMQANEVHEDQDSCVAAWCEARDKCVEMARKLHELGVAKQYAGRILEPFMYTRVVMSTTEINNWFWLRDHEAAQPEIRNLAKKMRDRLEESDPVILANGDWHTPYFGNGYIRREEGEDAIKKARKISASCCAQVSYRSLDDSQEKADRIFSQLIESDPVHASPVEHQATPIEYPNRGHQAYVIGSTHVDNSGWVWSGNFRGWVQHRQLIPNHDRKG